MRISLFERGQSVLLVGEGNFSFTIELFKLNLDLKLTSTSFEKHPVYRSTQENIKFLESQGVQVLCGIDATCLVDYEELCGRRFHQIIFNFPYASLKSKIHLNRELLRKFFLSCSSLLSDNGLVIVSLCQGQGGTCYDKASKQSSDTWQIVEMAAHGDLVLAAVEPWLLDSTLNQYSCVGRRSRDATFHREGALVHIFKSPPINFCHTYSAKELQQQNVPCQDEFGSETVNCSRLEGILLKRCLHVNQSSVFSHIMQKFLEYCSERKLKTKVSYMSITKSKGILRRTNDLDAMIESFPKESVVYNETLLVYWGVAFNELKSDFSLSPVLCYAVVLGSEAQQTCTDWVTNLKCPHLLETMVCKNEGKISFLKLDTIAMQMFNLSSWRELWAFSSKVIDKNGLLTWQAASVSPPSFTFDLSVSAQEPPKVHEICHLLWQIVGLILVHVEVVDSYESPEGWYSKCLRLTYCSYETPLYRSRVIKLQQDVIGSILHTHLGLTVR